MADRLQVEEYYLKSSFIKRAIMLLSGKHLLGTGVEYNNFERIDSTNENNFQLLRQFQYQAEELGRLTFWACRKTVDMNYNTICSALKRNGFEPELLDEYLLEMNGPL